MTNIGDVKIGREPMITSTTTHNISIENICTKDKRKDNNFINNQIKKFPNNTIVIFRDGSCQNNPGLTGAGSLVFRDGINYPPIKFAKAVSKIQDKLSWITRSHSVISKIYKNNKSHSNKKGTYFRRQYVFNSSDNINKATGII